MNAYITGRVGTVKEISKTAGGDSVLNFSICLNQGKDKDGDEIPPVWVGVTLWKEYAERMAPYIKKGDPIAAGGVLGIRTYEYDGETRTEFTLKFANVNLLGSGKKEDAPTKSKRTVKDEDVGF